MIYKCTTLESILELLACAEGTNWEIPPSDWIWLILWEHNKTNLERYERVYKKFSNDKIELPEQDQELPLEGKRAIYWKINYARDAIKACQVEISSTISFENLSEDEKYLKSKWCPTVQVTSLVYVIERAVKQHNFKRDKVVVQDYVVKEVLKNGYKFDELINSNTFLTYLIGAQLKTAKRWGLTESEYLKLKDKAKYINNMD